MDTKHANFDHPRYPIVESEWTVRAWPPFLHHHTPLSVLKLSRPKSHFHQIHQPSGKEDLGFSNCAITICFISRKNPIKSVSAPAFSCPTGLFLARGLVSFYGLGVWFLDALLSADFHACNGKLLRSSAAAVAATVFPGLDFAFFCFFWGNDMVITALLCVMIFEWALVSPSLPLECPPTWAILARVGAFLDESCTQQVLMDRKNWYLNKHSRNNIC